MIDISPIQILIVLAIALLVFGPKRLPDMARTLAKSIRDFRRHVDEAQSAVSMDDDPAEAPATPTAADLTPPDVAAPPANSGAADASSPVDDDLEGVIVSGARPPGPAA